MKGSKLNRDEYRQCKKCVMDTSDPMISFDSKGVCNHCHEFEELAGRKWFPDEKGEAHKAVMLEKIKASGRGKDYDCILGLSGGLDSSYLALKVHEWKLRPLVVHVDAGWNSELAVANIEAIVKHCEFDLHTHVVDWEEMRDLHLAFLRSGIANQDVPQDHIFFASLYHFAMGNGIKYILSGGNFATEAIFPKAWHGSAMDAVNLKAIHRKYGEFKLRDYKTISFFDYYFWYPMIKKMRVLRPLNYMNYNKALALEELEEKVGYKSYARKHGESIFTALFQNFYLPEKFGYDKRRPHFSSLIASGQMVREEALAKLEQPLYEPDQLQQDISYFCKKLRISRSQFDEFLQEPNRSHLDFPNWNFRYKVLKVLQRIIESLTGRVVRLYS